MTQPNKEIVARADAAFAHNKPEEFLALCADNIEWTMVGESTVRGKDEIRNWMKSMPSAEPPDFSATAVIAEGDHVIAYGEMTMKKEGNVVPYSYCDVYRIRDGKIVQLRSYVIKTAKQAVSA